MQTRPIDAAAELQGSLDLLKRNWQLAIPTAVASGLFATFVVFVIIGALAGVTSGFLLAGASGDGLARASGAVLALLSSATFLIGLPIVIFLLIVANVMTIVAAEDAWQGRAPDFSRAFSVAVAKLPALIVAFVLIALLSFIPALLILAFGLGFLFLLAIGFLMMYVTPAIVLGNRSGPGAIGESYRLVRANVGPSLFAFVAIIIVAGVGQVLTAIVGHIPVVNIIAGILIGGLTAAYTALVSARFYDVLRGGPEGSMSPGAPPPSSFITPAS